MVGSVAETVPSEANFNTIYNLYSGASNATILKRTCTSGTYCQIENMYYKRKDPAVSFAPYARLLTKWEEGTDNKFKIDFGLYSLLSDAIKAIKEFEYCSWETTYLAFGQCGPTAATPVANNAIGLDVYPYENM